ncbi:MAG: hypothetical protein R3A78_15695 [Polyangiales bacterium]|nr:hypothetical protein [Myxococcales bacterium]
MGEATAPLSKKWIAIGTVLAIVPYFAVQVAAHLVSSRGGGAGMAAFVLFVGGPASFFLSSALTAFMSTGRTIREPAIAAAIAVLGLKALDVALGGGFSMNGTVLMSAICYGAAILGAKLGERFDAMFSAR